jgi:hypothetical protein
MYDVTLTRVNESVVALEKQKVVRISVCMCVCVLLRAWVRARVDVYMRACSLNQPAKRMRHIILLSDLSGCFTFFDIIS